tara:strand:- start:140 stop:1264 length:1125 start_codon:yes stop_codon:yes gene_type:complete
MRIIISINTAWNIFNFRKGLIKTLQSQGHQIFAMAPSDEYVSRIEEMGVQFIPVNLDQKGINPFKDLSLVKQYYNLFNSIKPDLILSYTIKPNIYGNLAARVLKIQTINNISGLGTIFIKKNLISYLGKTLYRLALSSSEHVFFQNTKDRKLFLKSKLISNTKHSVIAGSGVDTDIFKSNKKTNKAQRFLFSGRLIRDKGVLEYLNAASAVLEKFPDREFLLTGELGANNKTALSKEELEVFTDKFKQIKYLGKNDDMAKILRGVDVMILPSYREGLSKSLIEAASMKLPIITTDVPGCNEVVKHNYNGVLCKPQCTESLIKAIEKMIILSAKERHNMGVNGRSLVEKYFKEELVIQNYSNQIDKIKTRTLTER